MADAPRPELARHFRHGAGAPVGPGDVRVHRRRGQHPCLHRARPGVRRRDARDARPDPRGGCCARRRGGQDRGRRRVPCLPRCDRCRPCAARDAGTSRPGAGRRAVAADPRGRPHRARPNPSTATTWHWPCTSPPESPRQRAQVRCWSPTASSKMSTPPPWAELRPVDVGVFELKDVREPMQLWRIAGDDAAPASHPGPEDERRPRSLQLRREGGRARRARPPHSTLQGLVTMVGPGGVGKTRLVSEYAVRNASDRADGIWMVELAPLTNADQVIAAVALTLGLSGSPTSETVAAELARRGKPLLILDNCEHLADAVADLTAELLRMYPVLSVVATSREALDVEGERIQRLSPLGVSEPTDGKGGGALAAAEELFLSRAQVAGGTVPQDDLPVVTEICRLLDGLPLAVELAAPRAASMPPRELLAELEHGGLQLRRRGGAQRQRNLDSLVGWSLDLLDAAHRNALLVLSVFPGRFTGEMARQVMDDRRRSSAGGRRRTRPSFASRPGRRPTIGCSSPFGTW